MRRKRRQFWHKSYFTIEVAMFKVQVGVAINLSEAELKQRMARDHVKPSIIEQVCQEMRGWDEGGALEGRMCLAAGGFVVALRLQKGEFRNAVATLTHEMVHVTQYLLRNRRIPLTEETEEVHAYLTEHLVEAALRRMY